MATIRVIGGVGDLANDLSMLATRTKPRMSRVVQKAAKRGNALAKGFAREDHTMFSDVDADYAPTFTVERITPLMYEYGPTHSKAPGYEHGSINQASPHQNLDRSLDIERVEFPLDVADEARELFNEAGF